MVNVRKMVTFNPVWDSTLQWYERAVAEMKQRPTNDPTSWGYQAAIHGTTLPGNHTSWTTCEHGGWYFFPWHRAYLRGFENIVRSIVVAKGGPSDWSLPYWDYEQAGKDVLPPAFRARKNPDNKPNQLFVVDRFQDINDGASLKQLIGILGVTAERGLSSKAGLAQPTYTGAGSGAFPFGFGGGPTPSAFQADSPADIEAQLHGNVHVLIGLGGGLMSRPRTAAQDPVFWLHHANIDRLWSLWLTKSTHKNPATNQWRTHRWTFFKPNGTEEDARPQQLEDTVAQLNYRYDSIPEPVSPIDAVAGPPIVGGMPDGGEGGRRRDLQPIGWSEPVTLTGHQTDTAVTVDQATLDNIAPPGLDAPSPLRSYLELSEIEAPESPGILYGVYLHAPGTEASQDALVGVVSFFGAPSGSNGPDEHRHRLRYVFDITDALAQLGDDAPRSMDRLAVTFRPLGPAQVAAARGIDAPEPDTPPVTVGRVAVVMG
jgi:Common central domain of tyrosinase